ncbi:unnamed protein product [Knipowitschia caucasica]
MKTTLLQAVNSRFSSVEEEPLYALATLVDPRYKDRYFTRAVSAKDALIKELEEEERSITCEEEESDSEPPEKVTRMEPGAAAPAASTGAQSKSSFLMEFDQILEETEDPEAPSSSSSAVQMQSYFSEKTVNTTEEPHQYWEVNRRRFPNLADAASKYLCAPCTSVESERLFSTVSNILNEKRNRLTAEKVAFLNKNLPLMK